MRQPAQRHAYPWRIVVSRTYSAHRKTCILLRRQPPRKTNQRGKNQGRSMILTDTPVKTALEAEAAKISKTTSRKVATTLVPKKEVESAKRQKYTEEETCQCLVCGEPFGNSMPGEKWVSCTDCGKWANEDCTSGDRCYVCHNC